MLDEQKLQKVAEKAARTAVNLLSMEKKYTVKLINDPEIIQDALFGTQENEILINLAMLKPFPQSALPLSPNATEEEIEKNTDIRIILMVCYLTFHEIRHLYQKWAVEMYLINRLMGSKSFHQPESDKKSALRESELKAYELGDGKSWDIEEDADAFAAYLLHRYPAKMDLGKTDRRMGVLKRKYDKIEISDD